MIGDVGHPGERSGLRAVRVAQRSSSSTACSLAADGSALAVSGEMKCKGFGALLPGELPVER